MVKARVQTPDGLVVEVEAEAREFEAALATAVRALRAADDSPARSDTGPTPGALQQMVERLSPQAIEYLRLLVEYPSGLRDEEITKALGLGDRRQKLAGMNGSITKAADAVGITTDIIKRSVERGTNGRRTYFYVLPPDVQDKLENVLPEDADDEDPEQPASAANHDDIPF